MRLSCFILTNFLIFTTCFKEVYVNYKGRGNASKSTNELLLTPSTEASVNKLGNDYADTGKTIKSLVRGTSPSLDASSLSTTTEETSDGKVGNDYAILPGSVGGGQSTPRRKQGRQGKQLDYRSSHYKHLKCKQAHRCVIPEGFIFMNSSLS